MPPQPVAQPALSGGAASPPAKRPRLAPPSLLPPAAATAPAAPGGMMNPSPLPPYQQRAAPLGGATAGVSLAGAGGPGSPLRQQSLAQQQGFRQQKPGALPVRHRIPIGFGLGLWHRCDMPQDLQRNSMYTAKEPESFKSLHHKYNHGRMPSLRMADSVGLALSSTSSTVRISCVPVSPLQGPMSPQKPLQGAPAHALYRYPQPPHQQPPRRAPLPAAPSGPHLRVALQQVHPPPRGPGLLPWWAACC